MIFITVPNVSIVVGVAVACNFVKTRNAVKPLLIVNTGTV